MPRSGHAGASARARLWLHGTDDNGAAVLSVLAQHLGDMPAPPACLLTGPGAQGLPGAPDDARAVQTFAQRNAPSALVLAGSMLPRALTDCARSRSMGLFLVDAHRPDSAPRWRLWGGARKAPLAGFTEVHCRDQQAAEALKPGAGDGVAIQVSGAMARFPPAMPCNRSELQALGTALAGRPVWFAQQLPRTEAAHVLLAQAQALRQFHRLLLVASPANLEDAPGIAAVADDIGLVHARRSLDEDIAETTQVYIADTGEDAGLFLRLAKACYLGGTLSESANAPAPLTALALGSAPVFGPHAPPAMRPLLDQLSMIGAGRQVASADALGDTIGLLLQPEAVATAALNGWELVTRGNDATDRVARALLAWLRQHTASGGQT